MRCCRRWTRKHQYTSRRCRPLKSSRPHRSCRQRFPQYKHPLPPQSSSPITVPRAFPASAPANPQRKLLPWGIGLAAFAFVGYLAVTNLGNDERSPGRPGQVERLSDERPIQASEQEPEAKPSLTDDSSETESNKKSIYIGSNQPSTANSEGSNPETISAATGAELNREVLGKYAAESETDGKASLIIDSLGAHVGDEASGYLLVNDERISLLGRVLDVQSERDDDGDSWRVYRLSMSNSDGVELLASLKHTDENIDGTLQFKSGGDADVLSFDVVDYSPN
jgi:hypothetical protein